MTAPDYFAEAGLNVLRRRGTCPCRLLRAAASNLRSCLVTMQTHCSTHSADQAVWAAVSKASGASHHLHHTNNRSCGQNKSLDRIDRVMLWARSTREDQRRPCLPLLTELASIQRGRQR